MIHVYKSGGDWKDAKGRDYTIKAVDASLIEKLLSEGWKRSKDECFTEDLKPAETADYERQLRNDIKKLGGKAGGRASIETLEKQKAELENVSN